MRLHRVPVLAVALTAVAALLPLPTAAASTAAAPTVAPRVALPTAADGLAWSACRPGAVEQCARLTVPLDWSKPQGPTTEIFVARVPARDQARRIGALAFNPGGPGGAGGSIFAAGLADQVFPQLRDWYDLVSFDPRGTGRSTLLDCGPVLAAGVPVFPESKAEYDAMVRSSRTTGERCLAEHGDLMRNLDTRTAARDLDAIRAALGEDKISYLGVSYGSYLGTTYAQLFPRRIHRMVLDGIVDHAQGSTRFMLSEAKAMEDGFNRFAAWCDVAEECKLHGRDVGAVFDQVVRKADKAPLPAPKAGPGVTVNGDEIRMALPALLPSLALFGNTWTPLAEALAAAADGDGSAFVGQGLVRSADTAYTAVSCMDFPGELKGYADARARLALAEVVAPRVGAAVEGWAMAASCSGWPIPPSNPWQRTPVRDAPPILIATTTHDPATPINAARGLARQIKDSRLLIADTYGHTAYYNSECARRQETSYLLTGELPPKGSRC